MSSTRLHERNLTLAVVGERAAPVSADPSWFDAPAEKRELLTDADRLPAPRSVAGQLDG